MTFFISLYLNTLFFFKQVAYKIHPVSVISTEQSKPLDAEKLTTLVNEWRVKSGFQPYIKNDSLCTIVNQRINDGMDRHTGFLQKYSEYPSVLSENMNFTYKTELDALNGWLNSPSHRNALEHPYVYSCIATKGSLAIQIFSNCENGCP